MAFGSRRFTDKTTTAGETTIIASGIEFAGTFSGSGHVFVGGTVKSDCDVSGTVTISNDGEWQGNIRASNVMVAGKVVGNVISEGNVELSPTAHITGDITASRIAVAEGAVIDGHMQTAEDKDIIRFEERRTNPIPVAPSSTASDSE